MITAVMLFLSGVVTYSDGVIKKNQWQAERDKLDSLKSARENPGKDDDGKVEKLMARNQELDSLLLPFLTMTKKRYPKLGQREGLNKLRINLGDPTLLPPQGASGSNTTVNSTFAIPAKLNVQWKTVNEKIDSFVVDNPPPVKTIKLPADEFPFPAVYRSVFVLSYFTPDLRQLRMKLKREDVVQYRVMRESGGSVDQSATKESGHGHTVSLQSPSNGRYVVEYVTVERINPGADLIFEE